MIPRDAMAELVGQLAGVSCIWLGDNAPMLGLDGGPRAWIELGERMVTPIGGDEYRQTPNANNANALDSVITGRRDMIITIRGKSFERDLQAYELVERVRLGLGSRTAQAFFLRHNIAPVMTFPTACFRVPDGHTTRLDAAMDWKIGVQVGHEANDDPGLTVATVNGNNKVPFTPT